jgi:hypothetical protein
VNNDGFEHIIDGFPLAYLITFTCYGTRLHGDPDGSIDRLHNTYDMPRLTGNPSRVRANLARMSEAPYRLDQVSRRVVLEAIQSACSEKEWDLIAAHVRTTHNHTVVGAACEPNVIRGAIKSNATRQLNRAGCDAGRKHRWTPKGSVRYLWKRNQVAAAVEYVILGQGEPMEWYEKPSWNF